VYCSIVTLSLKRTVFEIFDFEKCRDLEFGGEMSLKVIGTDAYWSTTCDFLLMFHSNHGPISHRFRDKRRLQWKIAKFSRPPCILCPAEGVPLELGIDARVKKLDWWRYQMVTKVLRLVSRLDTVYEIFNVKWKKSAKRDANTARALHGCSKVRTPSARPLSETHR